MKCSSRFHKHVARLLVAKAVSAIACCLAKVVTDKSFAWETIVEAESSSNHTGRSENKSHSKFTYRIKEQTVVSTQFSISAMIDAQSTITAKYFQKFVRDALASLKTHWELMSSRWEKSYKLKHPKDQVSLKTKRSSCLVKNPN
jgi:hypothetical protein